MSDKSEKASKPKKGKGMLVKAVAMQGNRGENPQRADLIQLVQRIIDVILDEVVAAKAKE